MKNSIFRVVLSLILTIVSFNISKAHAQGVYEQIEQKRWEAVSLTFNQNYQDAIPIYEQVIAIMTEQGASPVEVAFWLNGLATCKMYLGDTAEAEKIYLETLGSLDKPEYSNSRILRELLDALSVLYLQICNYKAAVLYNGRAKILYEKNLDFGDDYVRCLSNAASLQAELGHYTLSKMMLDVALRQAEFNMKGSGSLDVNAAKTIGYEDLGVDIYTYRISTYIVMLGNASQIYQQLGHYSDAIKALKKAIQIAEVHKLAVPILIYNNLGMIYLDKSRYSKASEWFLKAYRSCRAHYETNEVGMNVALALYWDQDPGAPGFSADLSAKIRRNTQDMFAFMTGAERAMYWKHFECYLPLLNMIIYESDDVSNFGSVYDNILEAKGLLLRSTNAIRDAILNSSNSNDRLDFNRICQLKQQLLVEADDSIRSSINREIEVIDKRLTKHVNSYADFTAAKTTSWKDVRDALLDDEIAIEFYNIPIVRLDSAQNMNGEIRYCAVTLKKGYDNPHIIPLCREKRLMSLDHEDIYETDSIYNIIWKSLDKELSGVQNIYFSADRGLHRIGIEYAPLPTGEIMGELYNIYRLSSTRVMAENCADRRDYNAVLYGGLRYDVDKDKLIAESRSIDNHLQSASRTFVPDEARYGVKYLPGTLTEVENIAEDFSNPPRVITGINGTEESFKSLAGSSVGIIHLATHGFFWNEKDADNRSYVSFLRHPGVPDKTDESNVLMRTGLFFSGANIGLKGEQLPDDVEDGVLTALELSNMNLGHVDMVVMSACDSGLGEVYGDGVFGLQRGFKLAGANTLLMSLWKVDDAATQLLMTAFYRHYLSGKSKQESLRLAQRDLRSNAQYNYPEYWAAFILLDGLDN